MSALENYPERHICPPRPNSHRLRVFFVPSANSAVKILWCLFLFKLKVSTLDQETFS